MPYTYYGGIAPSYSIWKNIQITITKQFLGATSHNILTNMEQRDDGYYFVDKYGNDNKIIAIGGYGVIMNTKYGNDCIMYTSKRNEQEWLSYENLI